MKVSGAYTSIVRGVSQQVPERRLDGQHAEQVNMISDPVEGLSRRRGTDHVIDIPLFTGATAASKADHRSFLRHSFSITTSEYDLLYRGAAKVVGSSVGLLHCFNKGTSANVPIVTAAGDTAIAGMLEAGLVGVAQVGRYLVMPSKTHVPTGVATDLFSVSSNIRYGAVWLRGGAYSRTFKVTVVIGTTPYAVSYTTPSSSYPGTLTTSDILASDPEYQKKVNDRVNAYNSAVTNWIGTAAAAIQPQAIAQELANLLIAAGATTITVSGSHILLDNTGLTSITATDSGDGSLIRAVHQDVEAANFVTGQHRIGKIVKVQAVKDAPAYYLKAIARVPSATGWGEVTWEEAASSSFVAGAWFAIGTVNAGSFYVASTPALLRSLIPTLDLPDIEPRHVGDPDTNKAPYFIDQPITYIGAFQDRLVVAAGPVITMSEVGNYFNFFRTSVLTVVDSDPVEVYAIGSENDTIRRSVVFDKSLLLFGDKRQYSINGRVPVTPATTSVIQSSAHEDATEAAPLANGDLIFYMKQREGVCGAFQIAIGDVSDTSNSTEVTQQLYDYIPGTPLELLATTAPHMLFARTNSDFSTIYTYRYLDDQSGRQRLLDSWSRWTFNAALGDLIGMSIHQGMLLLYFSRTGLDASGVMRTWLSVDRASLRSKINHKPYLDSARPYTSVATGAADRCWHTQAGISTAYDNSSTAWLQGTASLADVPAMAAEFPAVPTSALVSGTPFDSYIDLTNPYTRDRSGTAIVTGRLTVTRFTASYSNTAALRAHLTTPFSYEQVLDFNGRVLGSSNNIVGVQPVSRGQIPIFVGREVRDFTLRVSSRDWYPATLTGIEWTGQYFYNAKRV